MADSPTLSTRGTPEISTPTLRVQQTLRVRPAQRVQPTPRIQLTPKVQPTPARTQAELNTSLPIVGTPIIFISGNLPPTQLYYFHHHPGPPYHSVSFIMQWPTFLIYCHSYHWLPHFTDLLSFLFLDASFYRSTVIFIIGQPILPIYSHYYHSHGSLHRSPILLFHHALANAQPWAEIVFTIGT